jgi:signal peptidase I
MMKKKSKTRKWLEDIIFVVVAVLLIRAYVVQAYKIPTGSMENTLLVGDFLFATKFIYGFEVPFQNKMVLRIKKPKRGDIVIFRFPYERKDFVKRCMATAGDTIEVKEKVVYVNGERLNEPYAVHNDRKVYPGLNLEKFDYQKAWELSKLRNAGGYIRDNFGPVVVPEDNIFVMGDNRDNSYDSRFWGPLNLNYVRGKALIIYWSWKKSVPLYKLWKKIRWERIGNLIK